MRFALSFRNWSLGLATASFLCAGAAWAQPPASTQQTAMQQSWNLVGVNARLDHKLDVSNAHRGQSVEATLTHTVKTASGTRLDRGTQLWGKVDRVQASSNGGASTVSVAFTKARLKNGKTIPVKVTVVGVYPADESELAVNGNQTMPPPPNRISNQARIDQEPGLLSHISMHSAVRSHESATFHDDHGNLKLRQGTFLQVGIAAESQG